MSNGWKSCICVLRRVRGYSLRPYSLCVSCPAAKTPFKQLSSHESGFSLVEMIATISIMSILLALSAGGLTYYLSGKAVETSATELKTEIREAQAMALATGNTYRLDFNSAHSFSLQRRSGSDWITVQGPINLERSVNFSSTQPPAFGGDRYMECYAKGTCEGGNIVIDGPFSKTRTIAVDGETVNVRIT